eukprot:tig00000403_g306.t1
MISRWPRLSSFAHFAVTSLRPALLPLWGLVAFYLTIVPRYAVATPPPQRVWITAIWVAVVVGTALNVNGYVVSGQTSPRVYARNAPFSIMRFFLIPFCVASYSGVTAVAGESSFWYIFPREGAVLAVSLAVPAAVVLFGVGLHLSRQRRAKRSPAGPEGEASPAGSRCSLASTRPQAFSELDAIAFGSAGGDPGGPGGDSGPGPGSPRHPGPSGSSGNHVLHLHPHP